jgi:hypothetical protein
MGPLPAPGQQMKNSMYIVHEHDEKENILKRAKYP